MYRSLDSEKIIKTIEVLSGKINERFPDSGLYKVCQELLTIAVESQKRSEWIATPRKSLRVVIGIIIAIIISLLAFILTHTNLPNSGFDLIVLVQVSEAGINVFILLSAAILFLVTSEARIKRGRALKAIHELRALAHVIDMHQLTKDPERLQGKSSSSKPNLSPTELMRYLDYCSEMLSLIGKLAALYVQKFDDPVALVAVNEVEDLTNGLSRKIWQKIMLIHSASAKPLD